MQQHQDIQAFRNKKYFNGFSVRVLLSNLINKIFASYTSSVIGYTSSVISYPLSVISYPLSVISYPLSVISYPLSVISYPYNPKNPTTKAKVHYLLKLLIKLYKNRLKAKSKVVLCVVN